MSGGVDSSTVAALLKRQGHDVTGVGLRFAVLDGVGDSGRSGRACCNATGMEDARRVCGKIGAPFYMLNCRDAFEESVVDYFCRSYAKGETPNPCVVCNERVKFRLLLELAAAVGAERVATGHYARIDDDDGTGRRVLKRAASPEDDQSYFLYSMSQQQLSSVMFPLGGFGKDRTRRLAAAFGLPVRDKPASQDICFLPGGDYRPLVRARYPHSCEPGPIVTTNGEVIGQHGGIASYTVGQRKGLGVAAEHPLYVLRVEAGTRTVVVGRREELMSRCASVVDVNWIALPDGGRPTRCKVRLRHRQAPVPALVRATGQAEAEVLFDLPVAATAPGQAAVFYDQDAVIGGGRIRQCVTATRRR